MLLLEGTETHEIVSSGKAGLQHRLNASVRLVEKALSSIFSINGVYVYKAVWQAESFASIALSRSLLQGIIQVNKYLLNNYYK